MCRFLRWRSFGYLRISPLHPKSHTPLIASRKAVCHAVPRLSRGISQDTYFSAYMRFKPNNSEQRLAPSYYRGCWHEVSRAFLRVRSFYFFTLTVVYTPRGFVLHAASLRQPFGHCAIFATAALRGGPGSVSVPIWGISLSAPLRVDALVSHYLTNKLIRHRPLQNRIAPLISKPYDFEM